MDPKKTGARENRVCVTTDSGNTIWIPESRLEAWEKPITTPRSPIKSKNF